MNILRRIQIVITVTALAVLLPAFTQAGAIPDGTAAGITVFVGFGSSTEITQLDLQESQLVFALDPNAAKVETARASVPGTANEGRIYFERLANTNRLPLIEETANLVVVKSGTTVAPSEVARVLVPLGTAVAAEDSRFEDAGLERTGTEARGTIYTKPWPDDIDEWTHALYDSGGSTVSHDSKVGPPNYLQWVGEQRWTRNHDFASSFQAMVSAGGRIFYMIDDGPRTSVYLPSDWQIVARDAFNGKILWKRPFLGPGMVQTYYYKSGPMQLSRRLVADNGKVFVGLGLDQPVSILNAETGETLRTLPETDAVEEILLHDGVLYVLSDDTPVIYVHTGVADRFRDPNQWRPTQSKWIRAINPDTGTVLWQLETPVAPLAFAVNEFGVVFHNGYDLICLDRKTGVEKWRTAITLDPRISTSNTPTLVLQNDVVLFIGGNDGRSNSHGNGWYATYNLRTLSALSADTGKVLWSIDKNALPQNGFEAPKDLLVIGNLAWIGRTLQGGNSGTFYGYDIHTGEIKRSFTPPWSGLDWFHHRCFRAKATFKYIIPSRTGTEYINPETGWQSFNFWIRGTCSYGMMPANGLTYAPPHPCACSRESQLQGFNVVKTESPIRAQVAQNPDTQRLFQGPAYGTALGGTANGWPTYRANNQRTSRAAGTLPATMTQKWKVQVGENLTPPVISGGKIFLADKKSYEIKAISADTGTNLWSFAVGSLVDSPPTIWKNRVYFGCRNGSIYCLTINGQLVWRYQAAPADLRLGAHDQIESVWPVYGSVLIHNDKLYATAGHSMFLDDGLRMLVLNPDTGVQITENVMDRGDPTSSPPGRDIHYKMGDRIMIPSSPDILSADAAHIYMRTQQFDFNGVRRWVKIMPKTSGNSSSSGSAAADAHVFAPTGMLDDTGFHRTYWIFGNWERDGASDIFNTPKDEPAGRIIAVNDDLVFGFSRTPDQYKWMPGKLKMHIWAARKVRDTVHYPDVRNNTNVQYIWSVYLPALYVSAMVISDNRLAVAGPPAFNNDSSAEALARWKGERGGVLWLMNPTNGSTPESSKIALPSPPVYDGMVALDSKLFITLRTGEVMCME